ncbi:dimethylargininase [Actinosynnema sp. NPDC053489]|uniref:dimethylargininase n=1 Tax=Actinosynnema sp. NPDC053489 TaxID=3363916 RepID=UPI0037C7C0CB
MWRAGGAPSREDSTAVSDPLQRTARRRRYLMCPPEHFDVTYSINPWMRPEKPTDATIAQLQWSRLRSLYLDLGHEVELIEPEPGLPDMVFAANGATVVDGRVLSARFRFRQREAEGPAYLEWFREHGFRTQEAFWVNEGEGDYLLVGDRILAGTGFRTDPRSHAEAARFFRREVVTLDLVDPRFYHLDTALAVLDDDLIMYYPEAFSTWSRGVLRSLYPDAVIAGDQDAEVFGLNAVSDGKHVLLAQEATNLADQLADRGFTPIGVDLSELLKSGGSAKCCTLELRGEPVR